MCQCQLSERRKDTVKEQGSARADILKERGEVSVVWVFTAAGLQNA